jgi:hypothetical protein
VTTPNDQPPNGRYRAKHCVNHETCPWPEDQDGPLTAGASECIAFCEKCDVFQDGLNPSAPSPGDAGDAGEFAARNFVYSLSTEDYARGLSIRLNSAVAVAADPAPRLMRERDELKRLLIDVVNRATDGACDASVTIDFLRGVPAGAESVKNQRDEARAEAESLRYKLDATNKIVMDLHDNSKAEDERDALREENLMACGKLAYLARQQSDVAGAYDQLHAEARQLRADADRLRRALKDAADALHDIGLQQMKAPGSSHGGTAFAEERAARAALEVKS